METKPISKNLSKVLEKSRAQSVVHHSEINEEESLKETIKISLAEAGTFDTMESPSKESKIINKRKKDTKSKYTEDDSSHTVFWSKLSKTRDHKFKGSFVLPNCVKTFRVKVVGVDSSGTYGIFTSWLTVQKLFNVVVKAPPFIRSREEVKCFLSLENNQKGDMCVEIPKFREKLEISQGSGINYQFDLTPELIPYKLKIVDSATREKIFKKVEIPVYRGLCFENSQTLQVLIRNGRVSGNKTRLKLPHDLIRNTSRVRIDYKQLGIDVIMKGIENLTQQPSGGFEHTCSIAFSWTMLIQYIDQMPKKTEKVVNMKIFAEERLDETMEKFQRFECKGGGFEMFGTGEGSVTLSAYAIWLLSEMLLISKFKDATLLDKTIQWLRKNYKEKEVRFNMKKHLRPDQAHPSQFRSDLYIMFVLTLLRNRFADYKSIVHHKVSDYDMIEKKQKLDSYLRSLFAMIYFGKANPSNLSPWKKEKHEQDDGGTCR